MVAYVKRYEDITITAKSKILHYDFNAPNGVEVDANNDVTRVLDLSNTGDHALAINVKMDQIVQDGKTIKVGRFNASNIVSQKSKQMLPKRYYIKMVLQITQKYDSYILDTTNRIADGMSIWFNSYYGSQIGFRDRVANGRITNNIDGNIIFNASNLITVECIHNNTIGEKVFMAVDGKQTGEVVIDTVNTTHTSILSIGSTLDRTLFLNGKFKSIEIYDLDKTTFSLIKTRDGRYYTFIEDLLTIVPESETSEDKLYNTIKTKGFFGSTPERMQAIKTDLSYTEFSLVTLEM